MMCAMIDPDRIRKLVQTSSNLAEVARESGVCLRSLFNLKAGRNLAMPSMERLAVWSKGRNLQTPAMSANKRSKP